jgi:hypothetical protein
MEWFDSWFIGGKGKNALWTKGFTLLTNKKNDRSLVFFSACNTNDEKFYTVCVCAGSEGLELAINAGEYYVRIGIGVRL